MPELNDEMVWCKKKAGKHWKRDGGNTANEEIFHPEERVV
jgi:hypothetical protein